MNNKVNVACSFLMLIVMSLFSCTQNKTETHNNTADTAKLPVTMDDSSRIIIDRAIAYAGGYDNWLQKKTMSFDKKSTSFDSTGKVSREIDQHFDYMIQPEFRAKISYMLHDTTITLIHDGSKARKYYNGKISNEQKDIDAAWNSSYGSQYVMCMPYKLKDPGIKAAYVGNVTLSDGAPAQVVKTSYIKGAGSNPDDIWYYYFEPGTGKMLANSLNGKNNYWDYTRYDQMQSFGGLLLPIVRKGYNADTLNKPGRMVSQSSHSNIVIDKEFADDHFKITDDK